MRCTLLMQQVLGMAEIYWLLSRGLWIASTVLWTLGFTKARKRFNGLSKLLWAKRKQAIRMRLERAAAREAAWRERLAAAEEEEARRREQRRQALLRDPDRDTGDFNIHWSRLKSYGHSRYRGEYEFMGPRGGIYTVTSSGNRNYR